MLIKIVRTIYGVVVLLPAMLIIGAAGGAVLWYDEFLKEVWE